VLYGVSTLHFQMVGMQLAGLSGPGLVVATVVRSAVPDSPLARLDLA